MRFSLPTDAPARLDLLDVAGRRIASHEVDAGQHTLDIGEGQRLAPGLYLVRLTQGANTRTTRVWLRIGESPKVQPGGDSLRVAEGGVSVA